MPDVTNATESALQDFLKSLSPTSFKEVSEAGADLLERLGEKEGWRLFLKTLGPRTFTQPFSRYHTEFWRWYWGVTKKRVMGMSLSGDTLSFIAAWSRSCGKSANVEWACITEGAAGLDGYVLYVSLTQDAANKHVLDIRDRIEGEQIANTFPHLSEPKIGTHGNRYAWNQEFLVTKGGWAIRPLGLEVAIRGLRLGDIRPTMIVLDDIDKYNSSSQVVADSMATIARSILPSGTKDTIVLVAQNLIYESSIVNQIVTHKTDILSDSIRSVYPAFYPDKLFIDTRIDVDTGKTTHVIAPESKPYWTGMDLETCQRFLDRSGLEAFHSEYQHDFSLDMQDRVIPEYDDYPTHVIAWSQFEEKFGTNGYVPEHWQIGLGLDIGYSATHLSAWTWIAVSSQDSGLPHAHFRYRGKTFEGVSIPDQAELVHKLMVRKDKYGNEVSELNQILVSKISHEKTGEQRILNDEYQFNFSKCTFKREDGNPQWRNLLRVDKNQPHPFHADKQNDDGKWHLGRPNFFDVVDDDQLTNPRDDRGLAVQRAQVLGWKRRKVRLTQTGMQDDIPMKLDDDCNDSCRMVLAESSLTAVPLTTAQRINKGLREQLRQERIERCLGQEDFGQILLAREMAIRELEKREEREMSKVIKVVRGLYAPEPSSRFSDPKKRRKRRYF